MMVEDSDLGIGYSFGVGDLDLRYEIPTHCDYTEQFLCDHSMVSDICAWFIYYNDSLVCEYGYKDFMYAIQWAKGFSIAIKHNKE